MFNVKVMHSYDSFSINTREKIEDEKSKRVVQDYSVGELYIPRKECDLIKFYKFARHSHHSGEAKWINDIENIYESDGIIKEYRDCNIRFYDTEYKDSANRDYVDYRIKRMVCNKYMVYGEYLSKKSILMGLSGGIDVLGSDLIVDYDDVETFGYSKFYKFLLNGKSIVYMFSSTVEKQLEKIKGSPKI